jgi:diguanylate cyclase (GGDEF)-like protein
MTFGEPGPSEREGGGVTGEGPRSGQRVRRDEACRRSAASVMPGRGNAVDLVNRRFATNVDEVAIPEPFGWDDELTGLEGPDLWQRVLVAEVARATKYRRPLTVVVAELEGILELSETWGDTYARHAMRVIAQCLRRETRASDYCTRIALARFGVVLTETDEIEAINFVERVRESVIEALPGGTESLRLSFGWASPLPGESAGSLVNRAERRLIGELLR